MNLQQLRYSIAVAESGSITAAAKNLYMGQPNLSKSIKELEAEIGIRLFRRTARGVAPTPDGEKFLACAKKVLEQMNILEDTFAPRSASGMELSVAVSGVGYASHAFSRFLSNSSADFFHVQYRETELACVFDDVASGFADLGIVRCPADDNECEIYMRRNRISFKTLWDFTAVLLVDEHHPLVDCPEIDISMLDDYPEIICNEPFVSLADRRSQRNSTESRIMISDRSILADMLHNIHGSYMWSVPMCPEHLNNTPFVLRECSGSPQMRDLLIGRSGALSEAESGLVKLLETTLHALKP